jgi:phospholipid/cholesterol/gamma-HCH transport system ATP-binding protein
LRDSDQEVVRQFVEGLPDGPVPFHFPARPLAEDLLALDR